MTLDAVLRQDVHEHASEEAAARELFAAEEARA